MAVLLGGFAVSQMLYVAARLRVADHLGRGPVAVADLARECEARPEPLARVLRALAAFGVFRMDDDGRVANTPLSDCLRSGHGGSMRELALMYGEEHYHAMSELLAAVQRGGTAFEHAYRKPHFTYLSGNPDAARLYYDAMNNAADQSAEAVVDAYDFTHAGTVIDVAGGQGQLIRAVLRLNPRVNGVLVESSGLARKARARVRAEGLDERCEVEVGDLFEAIPRGGDVYMLGNVLHAWDDERVLRILHNCHRAMSQHSRLLIVERLASEQPFAAIMEQRTAISDALALAISGGRVRTLAEHTTLLAAAKFDVVEVRPTASGDTLIEAGRRR